MVGLTPLATVTDSPPDIPALSVDSALQPGTPPPQLLWVRIGTARVRLSELPDREDAPDEFRLTASEGLWIPAGARRRISTEPGTVAFPLSFYADAALAKLTRPVKFHVPGSWQDWLIQCFNLQVTPLGGTGRAQDRITDLVLRSRHRAIPASNGADTPSTGDALTLPTSSGARTVAEELLGNPTLDLTADQWATRVVTSTRTLRRAFLADTGLTFEQWRLRCRLNASVRHLAAGRRVDHVAALVGFTSRNGFTRAFRTQFGITPRQFTRDLVARPADSELVLHATAVRQIDDAVDLAVRDNDYSAVPSAPDLLLPAHTPVHTNAVHVLSWMYRGSGYLDADGQRYERRRGTATWIPAEVEHTTGIHADSISLPVGTVTTGDLQLTEPLQVVFPRAWDNYLMYCAVSDRSILRPDDHDPTHILGLFSAQLAAQQALALPMPTDPCARGTALAYLGSISAPSSAATSDLPADVHHIFRSQTGMSFTRWRYAARMRVARGLLAGGAKPSAVARRVGYAHLPTFSAAFSRFHGISPREYQEREAGTA